MPYPGAKDETRIQRSTFNVWYLSVPGFKILGATQVSFASHLFSRSVIPLFLRQGVEQPSLQTLPFSWKRLNTQPGSVRREN